MNWSAMFSYVEGDLLTSSCAALVNPVNLVGISGAGLAKQFRKNFPLNQSFYELACRTRQIRVGKVFCCWEGVWIINFPTKTHWRKTSRLEDIESGLVSLRSALAHHEITSVAIPKLGCGLGGLRWTDVRERVETALESWGGLVEVYE